MDGREYSPETLEDKDVAQIKADGSFTEPGVISVEAAMKLAGEAPPAPSTEDDPPKDPPKPGEQAPPPPVKEPEAEPVPAEVDMNEVIRVGGVEKTREQLYAELEDVYNFGLSEIPVASKERLLKSYLAERNDTEWKKSNTRGAQENATVRKELEQKATKINDDRRRLVNEKRTIDQRSADLKIEEARLSALASMKMTADETYNDETGRPDPDKTRQYNKILDARESLELIHQQTEALAKAQEKLEKESVQTEDDHLFLQAELLIEQHPELQLSAGETLMTVTDKVNKRGQYDHPDRDKLFDIFEILDEAKKYALPTEVAYDRLRKQNRLTVAATAPAKPPKPETQLSAQEKVLARIAGNQQGLKVTGTDGSQAARPQLSQKQSLGDKIRDASRNASGGAQNSALKEMDY